jgi:hypothetical protein
MEVGAVFCAALLSGRWDEQGLLERSMSVLAVARRPRWLRPLAPTR